MAKTKKKQKRNELYYTVNLPFNTAEEKDEFIEKYRAFVKKKSDALNKKSLGAVARTAIAKDMEESNG